MSKYIFITGTGRTATTYLSLYFQRNVQGAFSVHEPSKRIKLYSNRFVSGRGSLDQMRAVLERWRQA